MKDFKKKWQNYWIGRLSMNKYKLGNIIKKDLEVYKEENFD